MSKPIMMMKMCNQLKVDFDEDMMHWPKGYRDTDGLWASHWYNRVVESTGFSNYKPKLLNLSVAEQHIADTCQPYYEELLKFKIQL